MIRAVRTTLAALAVLGALLAVPAAARAERAAIGISDQESTTYIDPLFRWTGIGRARVIVPWDVALDDPRHVGDVLGTAHQAGQDILVSFDRSMGDDCLSGPCHLPTAAEYRFALTAFHERFPYVKAISPWNEANHPSQPTAEHPRTAAAYYRIAREVCPDCQVLGAELIDLPNLGGWLERYKAASPSQPRLWGLHNYGDVTRQESTITDVMLEAVGGEIWLTETGGLVRFQMRDGSVPWPYDEQRAARSLQYTFDLADAHQDRISRVYVYNWRAVPHLRWDSGLLSKAGEPRPSFWVLADRLHPRVTVPPTLHPALPRAQVVKRPRYRRRDGRVLATIRCPRARRVRCHVVMAVRTKGAVTRGGTRGRRTSGARGLLGERSVRIRAGHQRVLRVRVPRARRHLIRIGRTRKLKAQLWLGGPTPRQYNVRCKRPRRR